MERKIKLNRKTSETEIDIELNLDGTGKSEILTDFKFFNHILNVFAKHAHVNLKIIAKGDLQHHILEDIGILLGECFNKAIGNKRGIKRYGWSLIPMDDALVMSAVDISGRFYTNIDFNTKEVMIEDTKIANIYHFLNSFSENAKINLHLKVLYGKDPHHKLEAAFKSLAFSMRDAKKVVSNEIPSTIPSTKGIL
ncbi:MAG: imidazoleglycerol-phosphate dehydratase HisB [Promethearchaeota archaeon]